MAILLIDVEVGSPTVDLRANEEIRPVTSELAGVEVIVIRLDGIVECFEEGIIVIDEKDSAIIAIPCSRIVFQVTRVANHLKLAVTQAGSGRC